MKHSKHHKLNVQVHQKEVQLPSNSKSWCQDNIVCFSYPRLQNSWEMTLLLKLIFCWFILPAICELNKNNYVTNVYKFLNHSWPPHSCSLPMARDHTQNLCWPFEDKLQVGAILCWLYWLGPSVSYVSSSCFILISFSWSSPRLRYSDLNPSLTQLHHWIPRSILCREELVTPTFTKLYYIPDNFLLSPPHVPLWTKRLLSEPGTNMCSFKNSDQ